jgi:ABC-type lipoprotein release transport system permease subunit
LHAHVVGRAVVNNTYGLEPGVGGVIDGDWAKRLATSIGFDPVPQQIAVKVADGAPQASVQRELQRTFPESYTRPVPSTALRNLGRLRGLPWILVVMLVALAVGVTLHALVTAIRRRRHELAILRALGFTARDTRASLLWQTLALGAVAAVVGVPLGVMVGRLGWRAITYANGLAGAAVVPPAAIVVAGFLALAMPLLLVVIPAIRESRRSLGAILRVE